MKYCIMFLLLTILCFGEEMKFTKMKECEYDEDTEGITYCTVKYNKESSIVIWSEDESFKYHSFADDDIFTAFDCYNENGFHICNCTNMDNEEYVIYFSKDSVSIIAPEYSRRTLYR